MATPALPPLAEDEVLLKRLAADPAVYWRNHLIMAVVAGTLAGLVLMVMGNPDPWVGPVAAILAIGARAAYVRSEALATEWHLTDRRLLGPGRSYPLSGISHARKFFGDVQIITRTGDKQLIKYLANSDTAILDILAARAGQPI